jgi:hypothetical protein
MAVRFVTGLGGRAVFHPGAGRRGGLLRGCPADGLVASTGPPSGCRSGARTAPRRLRQAAQAVRPTGPLSSRTAGALSGPGIRKRPCVAHVHHASVQFKVHMTAQVVGKVQERPGFRQRRGSSRVATGTTHARCPRCGRLLIIVWTDTALLVPSPSGPGERTPKDRASRQGLNRGFPGVQNGHSVSKQWSALVSRTCVGGRVAD